MGSSSWLRMIGTFVYSPGEIKQNFFCRCEFLSFPPSSLDYGCGTSDRRISEFISANQKIHKEKDHVRFSCSAKRSRCFESLNYESVLEGISPRLLTHSAEPMHSGGIRHSIETMRQWFQRLYILSPELNFTIKTLLLVVFLGIQRLQLSGLILPNPQMLDVNEGVHHQDAVGKVAPPCYLDTQLTEAL